MKYSIIGAAKSGIAAALLAKKLGNDVFLSESKPEKSFLKEIEILKAQGIDYEFGGNTEKALDCETIITSPGVPKKTWIIATATERAIPIISELEFAFQHCNNPIIAITGTNGKTTTTALIEHIFKQAGKHAYACGNIGEPLSNLVLNVEKDAIFIVEVSSYQLEYCKSFRPNVAVIANITPDHLAYHGTFENYIQTKYKISSNQEPKDLLILNFDDEPTRMGGKHTKAKVAFVSAENSQIALGTKLSDDAIYFVQQNKEEFLMPIANLSLPGLHNAYNSMAAALSARAFEISNDTIRQSLSSFKGVEHRLELCRNIDGVDYINDSKATNVNAAWYALISYKSPLVWLAGGRGDNNDYSALDDLVAKNVKCIIAIGEEADAIIARYCKKKKCIKAGTMDEAVKLAQDMAVSGDKVLFSPACKSFDMFDNFEQRGEAFKKSVNNLHSIKELQ